MILMTEEEEEGKREIRGKKGGIGTLDQDQWWELCILLS